MSLTTKHVSLSALTPIRLTYKQLTNSNADEKLNVQSSLYQGGIRSFKHDALVDIKDAAFSKKTVVFLTSIKDLKEVFSNTLTNSENLILAGSCQLFPQDTPILNGSTTIKEYQNELFVGGKGTDAVFTIIPTTQKYVELKIGSKYLEVSNSYPFNISLTTTKTLDESNYQFEIDFYESLIGFKKSTSHGTRFVSYGTDRKFRCNGLQLNQTYINQYLFRVKFYNNPTFLYGYDPTNMEIKYYNSIGRGVETKSLTIKEKRQRDTNLLITLPVNDLANETVAANVSILKTNFSATGNYNTSI